MFDKKCVKCSGIIKDNFDFCPFCGNSAKSVHDQQDYGFLGKNDIIDAHTHFKDPFIERLFNNTMKLFERQMKQLNQGVVKDMPKNNNNLQIQFFINGRKIFPDKSESPKILKADNTQIHERLQKYAQLPREEPQARLIRLSGKLMYELEVPGVKSVDDVLINKLENSIEIKALSDTKIYSKNLNINLPVRVYNLKKGVLTLELQGRN
jgi:HSP20 family molecular chaperone IbpA